MEKTNKILLIFIVILIIIVGVFAISKIFQESSTAQGIPCAYIFKTDAGSGPFEMSYITMKNIPKENNPFLTVSPTKMEVTQLVEEYSYFIARCSKDSSDAESSWILISKDYDFTREISEDDPNIFIEPFTELWSCPPFGGEVDSLNSMIENGLELNCIRMEIPRYTPYVNQNIEDK